MAQQGPSGPGAPPTTGGTTPGRKGEGARAVREEVKGAAREVGDRARTEARRAVDEAKQQARSAVGEQRARAAESISAVARALRDTARRLDQEDQPAVGGYVERASESLERVSAAVREREISALVEATEDFARRRPALFLGGAVASGFLLGRFLKSSGERAEREQMTQHGAAGEAYGSQQTAGQAYRSQETVPGATPSPGPGSI